MEEREANVLCNLSMKEGTLVSWMTDGDSHHHTKSIVPQGNMVHSNIKLQ